MFNTEERKERVILIAVESAGIASCENNLNELSLLVETAGAEEAGRVIQRREAVHAAHYLGKGKIDEVLELAEATDADAIVADDELSPAQQKNLAKRLGIKILDRTMVILDIFAARAHTAEGKAQVELAQYRYRLSHLTGLGVALSRQAGTASHGGVGNRGPGEKKLESDRRHIRNRIEQLNGELKEIRENRAVLRKKRERAGVPVIALVGYTNAGKSTLMNRLTNANVLAENKLFATLDTTTRCVQLPDNGSEVLFTDTVGFINKLPHHLIKAFRATLEELKFADILIHVVDSSFPHFREQMGVVRETLQTLECTDKPVITVMNKCDTAHGFAEENQAVGGSYETYIKISARTGENIPQMLAAIEEVITSLRRRLTILLPYSQGALLSQIYDSCKVLFSESREDGTLLEIDATREIAGKVADYVLTHQ
ncbi:MAG: GTPase HflX [Defluviitaleaceae bacterium]|nr:GTPase HflX [Defluviitaleaceae bacterium]